MKDQIDVLATHAAVLNDVSDQLTDVVKALEAELNKLHLGFNSTTVTNGVIAIRFGRVGHKWGIVVLPDTATSQEGVLFADASRDHRISAVDLLPKMIEQLLLDTTAYTETVSRAVDTAAAVLAACKSGNR